MIRFMICDTDTAFLDRLAAALHKGFDPCSVEYMYGPSALEVSLRSNIEEADVLLTEIELRGKSAIDIIGRYLKASSPLQVIYMSTKIEYCTEVYATRHCGFIIKPVQNKILMRDVRRALEQLEHRKAFNIVIRRNSVCHIIDIPTLLYIESHGHIIYIITDGEIIETYGKIADLLPNLDKRFLQCHKSYLINMERVRKYQGNSFLMTNGAVIPISQSKRKEVRLKFLTYVSDIPAYGC